MQGICFVADPSITGKAHPVPAGSLPLHAHVPNADLHGTEILLLTGNIPGADLYLSSSVSPSENLKCSNVQEKWGGEVTVTSYTQISGRR